MKNNTFPTKIQEMKNPSHTKFIYVPQHIERKLGLEKGDNVEVLIIKEEKIKKYRCKACSHIFDMEDINPYCPACDSEDLVEIEELKGDI